MKKAKDEKKKKLRTNIKSAVELYYYLTVYSSICLEAQIMPTLK